MFEHYEVISRSVGDTTDIVTKEMYDFHDKGDRHITLRPEGTAPVVRSYVENKLFAPEVQKPVKVYYIFLSNKHYSHIKIFCQKQISP